MTPPTPTPTPCAGSGINVSGQQVCGPLVYKNISELINALLTFIIPFALVILLFVFILGGYDILMSQGSPDKIKSGRAKITSGIIGLLILIFSVAFVKIIAYFLNLNGSSPF